jgi:hypothetical protein
MEHYKTDWHFPDSRDLTAFTTTRVAFENLPVLLVTHDIEGDWQFLCGTTGEPEHCLVASLGCAVDRDPSLKDLADLPLGWRAWRDAIYSPWQREPKQDENENEI